MNEKIEVLYDELHEYMKTLIEYKTTSGLIPEVARVLIELINLQSMM